MILFIIYIQKNGNKLKYIYTYFIILNNMSIKKPTSAYQYYVKQWTFMNEQDKAWYIDKAEQDKKRYEKEILEKELEEEEEVKQQQIYLMAYTGGYSAVGLDNGAKSYNTVGPVVKIIEYGKEEQEKWGVKVKAFVYRDEKWNNCKFTLHHNQKYHIRTQWGDSNKKGDNIYTSGKTYNYKKDRPYNPIPKYNICKTPPKHVGVSTQHYTSFDNTAWTTNH
jgi:hypothetical protein